MRQRSEAKCSAEMKQNSRQKKLKGFTLAEVLITLVIIGVIAAITIPMITANARRQETSARLKKFYSTLSQASIRSKADGKDWGVWIEYNNTSNYVNNIEILENFSKDYLLPYINYMKTEKTEKEFIIYLNDGSYLTLWDGGCLDIIYDINGKKGPNVGGIDKFKFLYCPLSSVFVKYTGRIIPYQPIYVTNREEALNQCKESPYTCSALLMMDGWEFKDDYPHKI